MKPYKRILFLSVFVAAILIFWLVPRINKATEMDYTKTIPNKEKSKLLKSLAEDTLTRQGYNKVIYIDKMNKRDDRKKTFKNSPQQKKNYKKESEHSEYKLSRLKPKMYGRGMHFEEDELYFDSINIKGSDTTAVKVQ